MHSDPYSDDLDSVTNNLRDSAKGSNDGYDVAFSLTLTDMCDTSGRPVQFHWHMFFWPHSVPHHERNSGILGIREKSYSCRCSISLSGGLKMSKHVLKNAAEVTEYAKQFVLGHWCFCGLGQKKVWYRPVSNKHGAWHRIARHLTHRFEEAAHSLLSLCSTFLEGGLKSKKGKQTIHVQSATQTKTMVILINLARIQTIFQIVLGYSSAGG